jgi:hypothetical protein
VGWLSVVTLLAPVFASDVHGASANTLLKSAPIRWALHLAGAQTDKRNGLEKLRLTAEHGQYLKPYARLVLAIAALRDGDRGKARELLTWLAATYPHNDLYCRELAKLK